jgi:hypothetical protein
VNATALIALITAMSTLLGGLIGSLTSIRIHKSQVAERDRVVREQRGELMGARTREVRREAYVLLLTRFDQLDALLRKCWELSPFVEADDPIPDAIIDARDSLAAIANALNTVNLEGPPSVAEAGDKANALLHSELSTILTQLRRNTGEKEILLIMKNEIFQQAMADRMEAKKAIIDSAKAALHNSP